MCLFSGARLGEIAQLRLGDVRLERGVWFIHICHDAGAGLSTKSGRSRFAAVHQLLERIGFLDFHAKQLERVGGDGKAAMFPGLAPNGRGQISGTPSEWWRDYLTAIGIKNGEVQGGDGYGTHSFRHTLADRLRSEAELLDDQIEVCLGHNQKTVTSGYGELPQGTVTMFKGWMEAVRFEGVRFDHLFSSATPVPTLPVAD
ncbi:tyrosine-type recombinase/integrase [Sphingomonas kaistensis]|uniref:Tyrosine-type recombinase/integrase n=1 Tax=Sphingomonas kaistensis TaxID=298708 RepID=A0ABZ2G4S5_9SPHN